MASKPRESTKPVPHIGSVAVDRVRQRMKFSALVKRLEDFSLQAVEQVPTANGGTQELYVTAKGKRPIVMTAAQVKSTCFLIERLMPKAEAPKDVNLNGAMSWIIEIDDPTQRPDGYERRGKAST
jgi:hypothetical protein